LRGDELKKRREVRKQRAEKNAKEAQKYKRLLEQD